MRTDLDQIESEIPKGAFWMTGKFMRRVLQAIRKERRFAGLNGGLTEQPTKDGYALYASAGGPLGSDASLGTLEFIANSNGTPVIAEFKSKIVSTYPPP